MLSVKINTSGTDINSKFSVNSKLSNINFNEEYVCIYIYIYIIMTTMQINIEGGKPEACGTGRKITGRR
jgi:hypothetical protein